MPTSNIFEREVGKSLSRLEQEGEVFWFRLFDTTSFRHISEKIYAIRQPCDFIAIYGGKVFMLELKSSRSRTSFAFRYIRPHQLTSLLRAERVGKGNVVSLFLINRRAGRGRISAYAVRARTMKSLIKGSIKKSVRWGELERLGLEIEREKGLWLLKDVFEYYIQNGEK